MEFNLIIDSELPSLKKEIIKKVLNWIDEGENIITLPFAFLALLDPFFRKFRVNRPYLLLTGNTGSAKTTNAVFLQQFYGTISRIL